MSSCIATSPSLVFPAFRVSFNTCILLKQPVSCTKSFCLGEKVITLRSFVSTMPQYVRQMSQPFVRGLYSLTLLLSFSCLGISIVLLAFETDGWILLKRIILNKILSNSFMSGTAICFLSIPSGPEALMCRVRFRCTFISRTVIVWNTSPKSRALWPLKGMIMFGEVPHSDV